MCATVASLRRRSVWGDGPEQRPQGAAGLPPAKGGCRRVGAHNGDLRLEDRAGAPLQERLGPAEQGPERLDTRIRAWQRQAHQSVERINGAAPTLGGLVAAVPIADRGEPAGEPELVCWDCREPLGDGVGEPRLGPCLRHIGVKRVGGLALAKEEVEELNG